MTQADDHNTPSVSGRSRVLHNVLPQNLAISLQHLPEQDIKRLAEAVAVEMRNRGLTAPAHKSKSMTKGAPDTVLAQLTRSQISLIRASIQAGVKPAALSRQFGLTRAQITAAIKVPE